MVVSLSSPHRSVCESPQRHRPAPWHESPRAGSPLAILNDAKDFLAASPHLPPRIRPSLDPHKMPFGIGSGGGGDAGELSHDHRPNSVPGLPDVDGHPRRLPALSMETFTAMKRREQLDSRMSDPGARRSDSPSLGSRTKRRHHHSGQTSGAKSAPASRGTEVAEPLMSFWPPDAPTSEPKRSHTTESPHMRPHSTVNLGGMTPVRCSSTASLTGCQSEGRSKRPPHLPKRHVSSRDRQGGLDEPSPSAVSPVVSSPFGASDASLASPSPQRQRSEQRHSERLHSGGTASGYPTPRVLESPFRRQSEHPALQPSEAMWSSHGGGGSDCPSARSNGGAKSSRSLQHSPARDDTPGRRSVVPLIPVLELPLQGAPSASASNARASAPPIGASGGYNVPRAITRTASTLRAAPPTRVAAESNSYPPNAARSSALLAAPLPAAASPSDAVAATMVPAEEELEEPVTVRVEEVVATVVPAVAADLVTEVTRPPREAALSNAALLQEMGSEVGEASYGWDAGDSDEATSLKGTLNSSKTPLTCTRGPRGVTALSMSASAVGGLAASACLGESCLAAESSSSSANGGAGLSDTVGLPGAVKGASCVWVRGEVIGQGSLGSVFKALNQKTGEIFAVKEVRIDSRDKEDVKFKQALENEVSIYKDLHHPRIVSYLGHDDIDGSLCIYLEYMPGGSITQVLSDFGCFDEALIAMYSRDILEGLEYLHTREPVCLHRDVKGANILVGLDSRPKLSDFGCSKRAADTLSKSLRGSIPWMAPEVIQQTGYGRRSDVWSLGCVAIEMATAKHPWGSFDNPMAAMMRIGMSKETPPLPENVSDLCRDFIGQCTQRDKNLRPTASKLLAHAFVRDVHDSFD